MNKQEFLVANSSAKEGIINLDGTVKLQPLYDSIEILDKNDGRIDIKSKVNEGTEVVITIPTKG